MMCPSKYLLNSRSYPQHLLLSGLVRGLSLAGVSGDCRDSWLSRYWKLVIVETSSHKWDTPITPSKVQETFWKIWERHGGDMWTVDFQNPSGVSKPEPRLFRSTLRPDPGNNFWTLWSELSATLMSSDFVLCLDNSVGRIPVTLCLWKHASCPPRAPRLWVIKVTPDSGFYLPTEDFCGLCSHWPSLSLSAYRRLLFVAFHQTALLDQDAAAFVALCPPMLCNWLFTI